MPILPSRQREAKELIAGLGDSRAARRDAAVARLTLLGERCVPPLIAASDSPEAVVRAGALDALDRIRSRRALPAFLAHLADPDPRVAGRAVEALGRLHADGAQEAFEPLVALLLDEERPEGLRLSALEALRALPPRDLRPLLGRVRQSPRRRLARAAAALEGGEPPPEDREPAIRAMTIPALHRALVRLGGEGRGTVATASAKAQIHLTLARLDSRIALYDLREMLEARPVRAAGDLLDAAAGIGDKTLAPTIVALVRDEPGLLLPCAQAFDSIVRRESLRRDSAVFKKLGPEGRRALDRLWASRPRLSSKKS